MKKSSADIHLFISVLNMQYFFVLYQAIIALCYVGRIKNQMWRLDCKQNLHFYSNLYILNIFQSISC